MNVSSQIVPGRGIGAWVRGVVVAALALLASPALAQPTAQQVADRAIAQIGEATHTAVQALHNGTQRAVNRIQELDRNNASNQVIIAFGQRAIEALRGFGQQGRQRVQNITRNAVAALERLNAGPELIQSVRDAAERGIGTINEAQQRSVNAVRHAVEVATR